MPPPLYITLTGLVVFFPVALCQRAAGGIPPAVESAVQARMEVLAKAGSEPAPPSIYTPVRAGRQGGVPATALATYKDSSGISIALQNITATPPPGQIAAQAATRNLNFVASGTDLAAGAALRSIKLSKVVDGSGNDLLVNPASPATAPAATAGRGVPRPLASTLVIQAPSRDARSIDIIEGTAEIFAPTAANGALVTVLGIGERSGIPIKELLQHGIEFTVVTPASYRAMLGETVGAPAFDQGPVVLINDPGSLLAGYAFRDANGTPLPTVSSSSRKATTGTLHELRFQAGGAGGRARGAAVAPPAPAAVARTELPADGQIVFYLARREAVRTIPFRFEKIALP